MKKSYLWSGLGMMALGLVCLATAVFWDTPLGSLFCGFSGAFTVPGAMQVWKYYRWTRLETEDSWRRHVEAEQIELRDERKTMLRDKSGRYAYILGLLAVALAIVAFSVLVAFGLLPDRAFTSCWNSDIENRRPSLWGRPLIYKNLTPPAVQNC